MSGLNRVELIGHLGRDPELRKMTNDKPVVTFSVATSESWKDAGGERQERTEWHNIVIFNEGLCGVAERYLKKGSKVFVSGAMRTRKWTKDGIDRWSTEVVLSGFNATLVLLDRAERAPPPSEEAYGTRRQADGSGGDDAPPPPRAADMNDEIPF